MQCKIVAEGVENLEQLKFLEENRCETYQGFYFSKPIPFKALESLLHKEIMELAEG
jgi:EAL domain-containing protein (putative c-di-GMP-specific phosphodiesterase class I)